MSVYTVFADQAPRLHTVGCYQTADGTLDSWAVYQQGLYRQDETFHIAREHLQPGAMAVMHWVAKEIPPPHRAQIYQRHGLRERLSIVSATGEQGLFALNLYNTRSRTTPSTRCGPWRLRYWPACRPAPPSAHHHGPCRRRAPAF